MESSFEIEEIAPLLLALKTIQNDVILYDTRPETHYPALNLAREIFHICHRIRRAAPSEILELRKTLNEKIESLLFLTTSPR